LRGGPIHGPVSESGFHFGQNLISDLAEVRYKNPMLTRILLAVEPPARQKQIRDYLQGSDTVIEALSRRGRLLRHIGRRSSDLVIVSQTRIPVPAEESVRTIRGLPDAPLLVVLIEDDDAEAQALLTAAGADAVLSTAISADAIEHALGALLDRRREESPLTLPYVLGPDDPRLADFESRSPSMQAFMEVVQRVVPTSTTLLFVGETGVGKERLARAIHGASPRAAGPFVSVNCGALPETLLESELFGHEEGAFTGATRSRRGWFEVAHGGTIFLDEIGEMPHHLQVRLLSVIQTREVQRVGSESSIPIDVRVMAATNRDLEAEIEAKRFRSDLYYRLSVVTLEIPPLRERPEDIPRLVETYVRHFRSTFATEVVGIEEEALAALVRYHWPGNVREIVNIIERAMILCPDPRIRPADLPEAIREDSPGAIGKPRAVQPGSDGAFPGAPPDWLDRPLNEVREAVVAELEKHYLHALLEQTRGRIGEAATRAGIDPRSVYNKMRRYGLDKTAYKKPGPDGRAATD
jgi:DNA-binding NtrC family response regulator